LKNFKLISFIICSNGYGHLKRVLSVIKHILGNSSEIKIALFCPDSHIKIAKGEINFSDNLSSCTFYSVLSKNELNWIVDGGVTKNKFDNWKLDIQTNTILQKSHLIISDNHITPLTIFSNVKLMGSFLWDDVSNLNSQESQKVIEEEIGCLTKHKPDIFCLRYFAMPSVFKYANPIELPWFCEKYYGCEGSKRESILITGGGTALLNFQLSKLVEKIIAIGIGETIFLDSKLYNLLCENKQLNIKKFSFSDQDFFALKAIICRPGIGILTDCVKFGIPPIVINDGFNKEIDYNSLIVEELNIGKSFDLKYNDISFIASEIKNILQNVTLMESYQNSIEKQETNGAKLAAEIIINSTYDTKFR